MLDFRNGTPPAATEKSEQAGDNTIRTGAFDGLDAGRIHRHGLAAVAHQAQTAVHALHTDRVLPGRHKVKRTERPPRAITLSDTGTPCKMPADLRSLVSAAKMRKRRRCQDKVRNALAVQGLGLLERLGHERFGDAVELVVRAQGLLAERGDDRDRRVLACTTERLRIRCFAAAFGAPLETAVASCVAVEARILRSSAVTLPSVAPLMWPRPACKDKAERRRRPNRSRFRHYRTSLVCAASRSAFWRRA